MVLTALLIVDMVRRIRRVRYRAQVEEERAAAEEASQQASQEAGAPGGVFPADGAAFRADGTALPADGGVSRPEVNGDAGPGNR